MDTLPRFEERSIGHTMAVVVNALQCKRDRADASGWHPRLRPGGGEVNDKDSERQRRQREREAYGTSNAGH